MGIYSHLTDADLTAKRDQLLAAVESTASGIASVNHNGRGVSYSSSAANARRLLGDVQAEIDRRAGRAARGPIYMAA